MTTKRKPGVRQQHQRPVSFTQSGRRVYDSIHKMISEELGMELTHDQCIQQIARKLGVTNG